LLCFFTTVLAIETLDSASSIDQPLRAGIEGMAVRADFDLQLVDRRARLERVAAGASNYASMVFGMDSGFHWLPSLGGILSHSIIRRQVTQFTCNTDALQPPPIDPGPKITTNWRFVIVNPAFQY
jgi:hypothetical protein